MPSLIKDNDLKKKSRKNSKSAKTSKGSKKSYRLSKGSKKSSKKSYKLAKSSKKGSKKSYKLARSSKKNSKKSSKKSSKKVKKQTAGNFIGYNPNISKKDDEHKKCAPSRQFEEGSCIPFDLLEEMVLAFNIYIDMKLIDKEKIEIVKSKKKLLDQLEDRLKDVCDDDQLCWVKQDFVNFSKRKEEIKNKIFRPSGPQGKFTWLSTSNINQVMEQYHDKYSDFKYLGTVPMDFDDLPQLGIKTLNFDELYKKGIKKVGIVFNLDDHDERGSHWVALFANLEEFKIYYFDSYGIPPEDRVRKLVKRIASWCIKKHKKSVQINDDNTFMQENSKNSVESLSNVDIRYNTNRHQYKNSECGVYSMNFILRLLKGETFDDINGVKIPDDKVNKCRETYFVYE
jgi:hypothetical protein